MAGPGFLEGPYEILELGDGQTVDLSISGYQIGNIVIHPRYPGAPERKTIMALRLLLRPGIKPVGVQYYDVTSQTLIAQLKPYLDILSRTGGKFRITAYGVAPRKRFTVAVP